MHLGQWQQQHQREKYLNQPFTTVLPFSMGSLFDGLKEGYNNFDLFER